MKDPRVEKLARVMIKYSLGIRKGQYLMLTGPPVAQPLIAECYREAIRAGANVETNITLPGLEEIFYTESSRPQRQWISQPTKYRARHLDAACFIMGSVNTRSLTNCDPKKMSQVAKARQPMRKKPITMRKTMIPMIVRSDMVSSNVATPVTQNPPESD